MNLKKIIVIIAIILFVSAPLSVYGYKSYNFDKQVKLGQSALENEYFQDADKYFRQALKYSKSHDKEINEKISSVENLKKYKDLYQDGIKLLEAKKYIEAVDIFKKIPQDNKKYYELSQSKINESTNLYIEDNIALAKSKAEGKNYNEAITYLDTALKLDEKNQVVLDIKGQYTKEVEKIKAAEEEAKRQAQEELVKKAEASSSSKASSTSTAKTNSNEANKSNSKTGQNGTISTGIVKLTGNGWFSFYKNSGDMLPEEMFGLKYIDYGLQPEGIYYKFVGNNIDYTITIYLTTGQVKSSGKSSDEFRLISTPNKVPRGEAFKIDVSAVYKGKTYTNSFSKVINTSY